MQLENTINLLSETIKEINNIKDKLNNIAGSETDAVKQHFRLCCRENEGCKFIYEISSVLEEEGPCGSKGLK
jgi:hypothetical protein